ncbi:MAG TPA: hypothetical protein VFW00_05450, partial [Rhodocyclaceae bacterium]|nr:hypothetical protein [Rhodocyclaceae bacterium]
MTIEDIEFVQENIRKTYADEMRNKSPEQMQYLKQYLLNVRKSIDEVFAPEFRSGKVSNNLKDVLKRQHLILMTGQSDVTADADPATLYKGFMKGEPSTENVSAGVMLHENVWDQLTKAVVVLQGPDLTEARMEGPFP